VGATSSHCHSLGLTHTKPLKFMSHRETRQQNFGALTYDGAEVPSLGDLQQSDKAILDCLGSGEVGVIRRPWGLREDFKAWYRGRVIQKLNDLRGATVGLTSAACDRVMARAEEYRDDSLTSCHY
jgi:hypothetical protein